MFYCNELPFGIMLPNRFLNNETTNIISFYDKDEIALFEMVCKECYGGTPKDFVSLAIKLLEQDRWNDNGMLLLYTTKYI